MTKGKEKQPLIVAIGGGKGGVGKTMVCSNLAIQYARAGFRCVLIDLDLGAANVHTIFGMRQPPRGLGEFFTTKGSRLEEFVTNTDIPNLRIVAGGGFVPELANLPHKQKSKLINHIKELDTDLVLLDLGAGTSAHVIDFFSMCHAGIVVTTPEPTAIINAYEFLKNIIFRVLYRMFRSHPQVLALVKNASAPDNDPNSGTIGNLIKKVEEISTWSAQNIRDVCNDFDFYLVLNQARRVSETQLGEKLRNICDKFLNLDLNFAGMVFHNEEVSASVFRMSPVTIAFPDSIISKTLKRLSITMFSQMANKVLGNATIEDKEANLKNVLAFSQADYQQNLLSYKKIDRERQQKSIKTS